MTTVAEDVEITRTLNAISATLNDQPLERVDPERLQEIVDGVTGGERKLHVEAGDGRRATLLDLHGHAVASALVEEGHWTVARKEAE